MDNTQNWRIGSGIDLSIEMKSYRRIFNTPHCLILIRLLLYPYGF